MVFVSFGVRFLCNVEALNMVESIGNLSKHRKAPIVLPTSSGFRLLYVPAISGESLGHAYQQAIVEEALAHYRNNAPLDEWSRRGEFIKFGDLKHMPQNLVNIVANAKSAKKDEAKIVDLKHKMEIEAIKTSIVADIGGFLVAEDLPVKRTSCFQIGYAIPVFDALESTAIESQFHVRYVATETLGEKSEDKSSNTQGSSESERPAQTIYYVELASAVYGFTFNINLDAIGRTSMVKVEDAVTDRLDRIRIALAAASRLFTARSFGAKRSRFLPIDDILSLGVVVSKRPFVISPPQYSNFIEDTARRASAMIEMLKRFNSSDDIRIIGFSKEKPVPEQVVKADSVEEVFTKLVDELPLLQR